MAPGVSLAEQFSTGGERLGELRPAAVRLAASNVNDASGTWEWLRLLLATGTCALALGLGEQVPRMTSAYTAKREQFGHPVATFARIWAPDGVRRVVQTARHLHGGLGADVDPPLHRHHTWAKHLELSLGPAAAHEETLGDLPAAHPLG